ncbi:MAG: zinc metallopeptidase [Acutalibacteraceae bacterium]|nr:zinc metallopeptidase [Acutalibacteraceae bacterium]
MFFPYFYYGTDSDGLYTLAMLLLVGALLITVVAQIKVKSSFAKYSKMGCALTGAAAAQKLLSSQGVFDVKIERVSGELTDHFDPRTNTIRLSDSVYDSASVAAVGVACHEAGHALQYATQYAPIKIRNKIIPVTNFGSRLAMPLVLLGLILSFYPVAILGVAFFALSTLFQLITLPVELNASRRAISIIRDYNILYDDSQIKGAKSVLTAAALTYLGALLTSLAQLLRLLAIVGRRRR